VKQRHRTSPSVRLAGIFGATALILAACGGSEEPAAPAPAPAPAEQEAAPEVVEYERITLRVGGGPFLSQAAHVIADAAGYFDAVGIDIVYESYIDGSVVVSGLVGGDLDIGAMSFGAGFINAVAGGAPITPFLARSLEEPGFETLATLVTPEVYAQGITSCEDLGYFVGRKVAVPAAGAINQYGIVKQLIDLGEDPAAVDWMTGLGQPDIIQLLSSGEIVGANLASNFALLAEQRGAGVVICRGAVTPLVQIGGVAVRTDFLEANRDAVVRYAMAYIQGARDWQKALTDPDGNMDIVELMVENSTISDVQFMVDLAPYWSWIPGDAAINVASVVEQQQVWKEYFGLVDQFITEEQIANDALRLEAIERLDREKPFG